MAAEGGVGREAEKRGTCSGSRVAEVMAPECMLRGGAPTAPKWAKLEPMSAECKLCPTDAGLASTKTGPTCGGAGRIRTRELPPSTPAGGHANQANVHFDRGRAELGSTSTEFRVDLLRIWAAGVRSHLISWLDQMCPGRPRVAQPS